MALLVVLCFHQAKREPMSVSHVTASQMQPAGVHAALCLDATCRSAQSANVLG